MEGTKRTLDGCYKYFHEGSEIKADKFIVQRVYDYAWLFDIIRQLIPREKKECFAEFAEGTFDESRPKFKTQPALYRAFKYAFVTDASEGSYWVKLFPFFKDGVLKAEKDNDNRNIERLSTKELNGIETKDYIGFWKNSYGKLGNVEVAHQVKKICSDIKQKVKAYFNILDDLKTYQLFSDSFTQFINGMIDSDSKGRDALFQQSFELVRMVFGDINGKYSISWSSNGKRLTERLKERKRIRVFIEAFILCLLFGGLKENEEYIKKFINRRFLNIEWDILDFSIIDTKTNKKLFEYNADTGIMQNNVRYGDSRKCLLKGEVGAGKTFSLQCLGLLSKYGMYLNLNDETLIKTYEMDIANKVRDDNDEWKNHLKFSNIDFLFLDSLNEVMYENREVYGYICYDIRAIKGKSVFVASRHIHDELDGFELCELKVDINEQKATELAQRLGLNNDFGKLLKQPLFYNMAYTIREIMEMNARESGGVEPVLVGYINTKFDFFKEYVSKLLKPGMHDVNRVFSNLYVLPVLAGDHDYGLMEVGKFKDRVGDALDSGVERKKKAYGMNSYAKKYVRIAANILNIDDYVLVDDIEYKGIGDRLDYFEEGLLSNDDGKVGFLHEMLHNFLAALNYVVKFKLAAEYALTGADDEYSSIFEEHDNKLTINNKYYGIDKFILEALGFDADSDFESVFDKNTGCATYVKDSGETNGSKSDSEGCGSLCLEIEKRISEKTMDGRRLFGVLGLLESAVELAVIFYRRMKERTLDEVQIQKYCRTGLELLRYCGVSKEFDKEDNILVASGLLERDLKYYRKNELVKYLRHINDYKEVFDYYFEKSEWIKHQRSKFDLLKYDLRFKRCVDVVGLHDVCRIMDTGIILENGNLHSREQALKRNLEGLRKDLEAVFDGLDKNDSELSSSTLTLIYAYPSVSLRSLGFARDVKKAFLQVAKIIKKSRWEGTSVLAYSYELAYRLLLFDVKILDGYNINADPNLTKLEGELVERNGCFLPDELGTMAFLGYLGKKSTGLGMKSIQLLQLCEKYIVDEYKHLKSGINNFSNSNDAEEKKGDFGWGALEKIEETQYKNHLLFQVLKYCVISFNLCSGRYNMSVISADKLRERIEKELLKFVEMNGNPDEKADTSFERTGTLYQIDFALKLYRRLKGGSVAISDATTFNCIDLYKDLLVEGEEKRNAAIAKILGAFDLL